MRSAAGRASSTRRVNVHGMREDAAWVVGEALSAAWRHAYAVGYEPIPASMCELLMQWHRLTGERALVCLGHPLVLALSRGAGVRPLLLICEDAIARYAHDLASGRRLASAIERVAAHTPTGVLGGYSLACDAGGQVRWAYAVRVDATPAMEIA